MIRNLSFTYFSLNIKYIIKLFQEKNNFFQKKYRNNQIKGNTIKKLTEPIG